MSGDRKPETVIADQGKADFIAAVRALSPNGQAALLRFAVRHQDGHLWEPNLAELKREMAMERRRASE